jgi:hypothetical protein
MLQQLRCFAGGPSTEVHADAEPANVSRDEAQLDWYAQAASGHAQPEFYLAAASAPPAEEPLGHASPARGDWKGAALSLCLCFSVAQASANILQATANRLPGLPGLIVNSMRLLLRMR